MLDSYRDAQDLKLLSPEGSKDPVVEKVKPEEFGGFAQSAEVSHRENGSRKNGSVNIFAG